MDVSRVAIIAPAALSNDRIFEPEQARDNVLERFKLLRQKLQQRGIDCRTADRFDPRDIDVLIFHDIMNELTEILRVIKAHPRVRLIYLPNEPPFVVPLHAESVLPELPVDLLLTWNDRIAGRHAHVQKFNIGQPVISRDEIPVVPFDQKRFICSVFAYKPPGVSGTLFEERLRAVEFFARQQAGIDLYGIGWEAAEYPFVRQAYRGAIDNKLEIQQQYRFSIAFENTRSFPGLITEKIFDCFAAGSVPVYLGAPNVSDYIPAECFIDVRDYAGYEELYDDLVNMSQERYGNYLAAVRKFLGSTRYRRFTSDYYAEDLCRKIGQLPESSMRRSVVGMKWALARLVIVRPALWRNWRRFRLFLKALAFSW